LKTFIHIFILIFRAAAMLENLSLLGLKTDKNGTQNRTA